MLSLVICIISIAFIFISQASQSRLTSIPVKLFKTIRIKRIWFLFTAMGCWAPWKAINKTTVQKTGIVLSMFIMQVLGYLLALATLIAMSVFLIMQLELFNLVIVSAVCLGIFTIVVFLVIFATSRLGKHRKKKSDGLKRLFD